MMTIINNVKRRSKDTDLTSKRTYILLHSDGVRREDHVSPNQRRAKTEMTRVGGTDAYKYKQTSTWDRLKRLAANTTHVTKRLHTFYISRASWYRYKRRCRLSTKGQKEVEGKRMRERVIEREGERERRVRRRTGRILRQEITKALVGRKSCACW